jgi:hypothetical protein
LTVPVRGRWTDSKMNEYPGYPALKRRTMATKKRSARR